MRFLIAFLICIVSGYARAQDLIVTTTGDSIHCEITTIAPKRIFYTHAGTDSRTQDIPIEQVAMYQRKGFFPVILGNVVNLREGGAKKDRWLLELSVGYSRLTAPAQEGLSAEEKDYIDRMRNAMHLSASIGYFWSATMGISAEYHSMMNAKATGTISFPVSADSSVTGPVEDDLTLTFIGANLETISPISLRTSFYASVGIGYLKYRNDAVIIERAVVTGHTFALNLRLGVDVELSKKVGAGIQVGYLLARMDRLEYDFGYGKLNVQLPNSQAQSVNHLDAGLALRLRL